MSKILIIGVDNPIGWTVFNFLARESDDELIPVISQNDDIFYFIKNKIIIPNLHNKKIIKKLILSENPDVIINCLFDTYKFDQFSDKQDYWHNNYSFIENILRAAVLSESHVITFSSELVFDGNNGPYNEEQLQLPNGFIGKTMLAIENFQKSLYNNLTILRLTDYYGFTPFGFNFYLDNIFAKRVIDVESNYLTNPVYIDDIAVAVMKVIEQRAYGIFNLGGEDYLTKADYIKAIIRNNYIFERKFVHEVRDTITKKYGLVNLKATTTLSINFANIYDGSTSMRYALSAGEKSRFNI